MSGCSHSGLLSSFGWTLLCIGFLLNRGGVPFFDDETPTHHLPPPVPAWEKCSDSSKLFASFIGFLAVRLTKIAKCAEQEKARLAASE